MPNSSSNPSSKSLPVESEVTPESEATTHRSSTQPSSQAKPQPLGLLGALWVLVFRTGVLVVSSSMALGVGIAIATRYPAEVDEPPLLEKVLQGIETVR
ncbi:MAG: hypothetical protein F6K30_07940 [Cyanothece sp. SIO2G6]|nr:hypothetical protein [Cyanothece sp. SIO2G6]